MENISVSVRVRPLNKQEVQESFAWRIEGNSICQAAGDVGSRDTKYSLDNVFGPTWTNREIYEATTPPLIRKVVSGFNSTVFAYGQTSSGKTFTMRGCLSEPGLIPLAVHDIFSMIAGTNDREFLLRVSYMELYNEEVNDLLAPQNKKLPIHESKENGVYVCGLREDIVTGPEQVLALLEEGENNRHTGSTRMNETSSRSHTVFRMVVESRSSDAECDDAGAILVSTLTLVDLAGSERVAKTGAEGIRMKEGTAINKSLLTLGLVINKLSEGAQTTGGHIPYRDSKLTRILQPSLGGNAKTAIIAAITPAGCHQEESHSTLRFACRAKCVVNNARLNEVVTDAAVLKRQASEIEELKHKLTASGLADVDDKISNLRAQLLRMEQEKELMQVKLQEETMEREKAQKQAEVAKKMMFSQQRQPPASGGDSGGKGNMKRGNRRETWCPGGKAGWVAPHDGPTTDASDDEHVAGSQELGPTSGGKPRKRPFVGEESAGGGLAALREEDEEEGDESDSPEEGPTPQRPRREKGRPSSISTAVSDYELVEGGEDALLQDVQRSISVLPRSERPAVEALVQLWREMQVRHTLMEQELDDISRIAQSREENLRSVESELESAVETRDKLVPQVEQLKWQSRQVQKTSEETQEREKELLQEKERLLADMAALQASVEQKEAEMNESCAAASDERAASKEQLKALGSELADAKALLELQATEKGTLEARQRAHASELLSAEARLRDKTSEADSIRKALEESDDRVKDVESRCRELYDCNKRLEEHVADLQSRKRAPLYQKKQEDELKAAVDKSAEAEIRALDAELKSRDAKASVEEAEKKVAELEEAMEKLQRQSAESASLVAEQHTLEQQRLSQEKAKLIAGHDDALASLTATIAEGEASLATVQAALDAQTAKLAEMEDAAKTAARHLETVETAKAELEACAMSASARVAQLEEESEATQAAHETELAALRAELDRVTAEGTKAVEALREEMRATAEAAAQELNAANGRAEEMARAALHDSEAAGTLTAELRQKISEQASKLAEAAGALRAKEELREERARHKQEMSATKVELQKLQLETKSGAKSKDMAAKEVDTLKKRLSDLEGKLKVAVADKQAAVSEKATLDKQLRQQTGQKMLIEKNLERKDNIESKKRESIMVNLSKSKEQLSTVEERFKSANVELQKLQMDMMAKKGECTRLEEQVEEQEASIGTMRTEAEALNLELTTVQHNLECLQKEHADVEGALQSSTASLEALRSEHDTTTAELVSLQHTHASLVLNHARGVNELGDLKQVHGALVVSAAAVQEQLTVLVADHEALLSMRSSLESELGRVAEALGVSENARTSAEARIPELEELQKQIALTHEELSDLRFQWQEDKAGAAAAEAALKGEVQQLGGKLSAAAHDAVVAAAALSTAQQHADGLQRQLDEALELYEAVNGQLSNAKAEKLEVDAASADQAQALIAEIEQLKAESAASQQLMEVLNAKLVAAQTQVKVLQSEVGAAQQEATSAAEAFAQQLAGMQSRLAQAEADIVASDVAKEEANVARAEAEAAKTASEAALNASAHAATEACELRQRLARATEEAAAAVAAATDTGEAAAGAAAQMHTLRAQLAKAADDLAQVNQDLNDMQFSWNEERASAAAQQRALHQQLDSAQQTCASEKEQATNLSQKLVELQAQVTQELTDMASSSNEERASAAARQCALEQQLDSAQQMCAAEMEQATNLSQKLAELQAQVTRDLADTKFRWNEERVSTSTQQHDLQEQLDNAQQMCASEKERAANLSQQLVALQAQVTQELTDMKSSSTEERASAAAQQHALQQQLDNAQQICASEKERTADLSRQLAALQAQVTQDLTDMEFRWKEERASTATQQRALQEQLDSAQQMCASKKEQASNLSQQLVALQAQVTKELTDNDLSSNEQRASSATQQFALQQQLDSAQQMCAAETERAANLSQQLVALQAQVTKDLTDMKSSSNEERASAVAQQLALQQQLESVRQMFDAEKEQAENLSQKLVELQAQVTQELTTMRFSANEERASAVAQQHALQQQLDSAHQMCASEKEQAENLSQQLVELQAQVTKELNTMEISANEERVSAAAQQHDLQRQLDSAQQMWAAEKEQAANLSQQLVELQTQVAVGVEHGSVVDGSREAAAQALQSALAEKSRDVELLKDFCAELKSELEALLPMRQEHEMAVKTIQEQQVTIQQLQASLFEVKAELEALLPLRQEHEMAATTIQELQVTIQQLQTTGELRAVQAALEEAVQVRAQLEQKLASIPLPPATALASTAADAASAEDLSAADTADAEQLRLALSVAEQERGRLVQEMSEVLAAGNRAAAEKDSLERSLNQRILELERAGFELQDQLAEAKACYEQLSVGTVFTVPTAATSFAPNAVASPVAGTRAAGWNSPASVPHGAQAYPSANDDAHAEQSKSEFNAALQRAAFLEGEVARLRSNLAAMNEEKEAVEVQLAAAVPAGQGQGEEANGVHLATVADLEAQLQQSVERCLELEGMVREVEEKLKVYATPEDVELLASELAAAISATQLAESQSVELLDLNIHLESKLAQLSAAVQHGATAAAAHAEAEARWQTELAHSQDLLTEALKEVEVARSARQAAEQSAASWSGLYELLKPAHDKLQLQVRDLEETVARVSSQPANGLEQQAEAAHALSVRLSAFQGAVERLQDELGQARKTASKQAQEFGAREAMLEQQVQSLLSGMEDEREQQLVAVEELQLSGKHKEAELNGRMLSLESQIHWLSEQNKQLSTSATATRTEGGASGGVGVQAVDTSKGADAEVAARCDSLEADLRKSRRAEQKLQALLFRLRKDVADAGDNLATAFDGLKEVRSLEYDDDMVSQKLKRYERQLAAAEAERKQMAAQVAALTAASGLKSGGGAVGLELRLGSSNALLSSVPSAAAASMNKAGETASRLGHRQVDKENYSRP